MITSTQPKNEREAAVIARARQLTDFVWTPVRDVPTYLNEVGNTVLLAGEQVTGFPYSSCETNDKFFCENVSFETFLSAIPNPESKLYSVGEGSLRACSYGVVCNGFVRYVFGIPYRVSTKRWFTIKGMNKIKEKGEFTVEDMRLCDVLHAFNDGRNHVSLVTDILRDENGKVAFVEISEAVRPSCKRRLFTPEQFYEKYKPFSLCRYEFIDNVPLLDKETDALLWNSGIEKKRPKITVNNGNKSNYLIGEPIIFSVFADENDTIQIIRGDELVMSMPVGPRAFFSGTLEKGYYVARLKNSGDFVEFAVNGAAIRHELCGNTLTVYADPCDENSEICYADFREAGEVCAPLVKYEVITDEEKKNGVFTRELSCGVDNYKVYFKNKYGVWTHRMKKI